MIPARGPQTKFFRDNSSSIWRTCQQVLRAKHLLTSALVAIAKVALQRLHCKHCIAKIALQRFHCQDCIAEIALQRLHCKDCIAEIALQRLHCKECIAKVALQRMHCKDCIETLFGVHAQVSFYFRIDLELFCCRYPELFYFRIDLELFCCRYPELFDFRIDLELFCCRYLGLGTGWQRRRATGNPGIQG